MRSAARRAPFHAPAAAACAVCVRVRARPRQGRLCSSERSAVWSETRAARLATRRRLPVTRSRGVRVNAEKKARETISSDHVPIGVDCTMQ